MPLARRYYLALAGIGEQLFKTLQRRDQVPVFGAPDKLRPRTEEEAEQFHRNISENGYSFLDAVMLATADKFVTQNSFTRDAAKAFLERSPELTVLGVKRVENGEEIWIAGYDVEVPGGTVARGQSGSDSYVPTFSAFGTLDEVMSQIRSDLDSWGDTGRSINLINLTPIVLRAKAEAEKIGFSGRFVD